MPHETYRKLHILSQTQCTVRALVLTAAQGLKLQAYSLGQSHEIILDATERQAALRALPRPWLWEALGFGGVSAAEEAAAELARLTGASHEASYPHCPNPDLCPGCVGACLLRDATARNGYRAGCEALGHEDTLPPCEER